ncbi:hypothetical protein KVR01_005044 [Diaporthe batatas]|uniref:uncharacterized protein n=1 Tax=Diaporthe batatas TaxID=748121 RepID=UPI001D05C1EF|nr:uncharacterized protein KVR01_005044 [Diaporthe batatas]KAG8164769.1 hypothetical protein KVR01_005044 [Diaporthe batatas]
MSLRLRKRRTTHLRAVRCNLVEIGTKGNSLLCKCHKRPVIMVCLSLPAQPEYAHVGALDGSSSTETIKFPRNNAKRHASYVARAPPPSRSARPIGRPRRQNGYPSSRAVADNRIATLGPLAEESFSKGLSQQDCLSCLISPTKHKALPIPPSGPAQTREQSKNLARFTKQLERYSSAVNANGKPELPLVTPTVSDSPTTLDTVAELLPYHKQFKAAGLAVTSREQMPRVPESTAQRRTVVNNRNGRDQPVQYVQVDGSTVSPSEEEEESVPGDPVAVSGHESEAGSSESRMQQQAPSKAGPPINKALLPWFRKTGGPTAVKSHSNRKFSVDHIHPSQASAAEPYLTPSDKLGIIDAYFDSPSPAISQIKQPEPNNTSSSSSSPPRRVSSPVNTPRRKGPPIERQPIPWRSPRRHMKDTSQWPTAGVLIHDKSPSSEDHANEGVKIVAATQQGPPVPTKDPTPGRSQLATKTERVRKSAESGHGPPIPPKVPHSKHSMVTLGDHLEEKPATPPKDFPVTSPQSQVTSHHHTGQSLCKPWSRVTVLRRKSHARLAPVPATIQEETEATATQSGKPNATSAQDTSTAPQLPDTWTCAVGRSSSFEKALDAVIQKLDDMDERRKYERKIELEAAQQAAAKLEASQELVSNYGSPSGQRSRRQTEEKVGSPGEAPSSVTNESAAHLDRDIDDRDILLGLKMAICAACDEDLDAWIRDRTGLRLRRFLADLKAFDAVSRDRKPPASRPARRQVQRTPNEARRLNAERERRRQSMKSKGLKGHCFGEDG